MVLESLELHAHLWLSPEVREQMLAMRSAISLPILERESAVVLTAL